VLGSDANLYRSAKGFLATTGSLEVRTLLAHMSVTLSAKATNPPAPLPGTQAHLYVKGGKLVILWNNGQQPLYTTIPLDSPGPYPATPVVTTDTTPP
jgi:hypothetical protein